MTSLIYHLLLVAVVFDSLQLVSGYSFNNCIAKPHLNGQSFICVRRNEKELTAIVKDLLPSAVHVVVSVNPIRRVPNCSFAHLPKLLSLQLDRNNLMIIDELAFQNLHQLNKLNLSYNNISQLSPFVFQDLYNLTSLSLTHNKLKQLPVNVFSNIPNLNTLIMGQNLLKNFSVIAQSVSHLTNLQILDLCFNNLTSLTHSNGSLPKSLTMLYVCENQLTTLGCHHSFLSHIKLLDLSYNGKLSSAAFEGTDLSKIEYLRLRSTDVKVKELLNISNVNVGHVDFSGMGLINNSLLLELCRLLKGKVEKIKNLHLCNNGIRSIANYTLNDCPTIMGTVDLSHNSLKNTSRLTFLSRQSHLKNFTAEHNNLKSLPSCKMENAPYFPHLEMLSYRYNRILTVGLYAFYHTPNVRTLKLNINTIAFLHRKALRGLTKLETLYLDNNLLTDLFNDTFEDNSNLQALHLRNNRICVIFNGTFFRLSNLTVLDLGGNTITHFEPSGLDGLRSLSKLYLDGNKLKQIDSAQYHVFQATLTMLDLANNNICFRTETSISPFQNFSKLSNLSLSAQMPYGMTLLPPAFFRGLHSLTSLYLTNNEILRLAPDAFDDLVNLNFLTLENRCMGVAQLQPGIFKNLRNLSILVVQNMGIQNFSKEVFGNLTQLHTLQLNHNVMQSIEVEALDSLPNLQYLDIRNIPLICTCQNRRLQNWTLNNQNVQVIYLYKLPCPHDTKHKFYNFDINVCYIDLGHYLFFTTAAVIFLFTVIPLVYVKLYWRMKYSYYVFRAWFSEQWRRLREEEENCKYDAFISYNSSDEDWVMNQLLPNLEGKGWPFKLCLHHRDFELGRDIVDNIVMAVYSSRKTICVVSRNFLQSEWCSLEIQLASYRLFDEHRDVLLLVFLEPLSERQVSSYHRMRKVMLKKTYLQWPGSDCTDLVPAQQLFWNQLRQAMRKDSRLEEESNSEGHEENDQFAYQLTDQNYLLP